MSGLRTVDAESGTRFGLGSSASPQPALFALALLGVIAFSADARAGVMIPWSASHGLSASHGVVEACPADAGLLPDSGPDAGSRAPAMPAEQTPTQAPSDEPSKAAHVDAFHTTNGTSAPTNGSGGTASGSSPMLLSSALADQPAACAFRNWRERSPQLPGLSPRELLDPPKASA